MKSDLGNKKWAILLLVSMYVAGFIGLNHANWSEFFKLLVPFNLILTSVIAFYFHKDWSREFAIFLMMVFSIGYGIEWLGVRHDWIFGQYFYKTTLGYKVSEVPLIIGLNWMLLIYVVGVISNSLGIFTITKAFSGAILMVLLDFFIEPVAIHFDFWQWQGGVIPNQNYITWFIISFVLLLLFHTCSFYKKNSIAWVVYLIQLLFFIFLSAYIS